MQKRRVSCMLIARVQTKYIYLWNFFLRKSRQYKCRVIIDKQDYEGLQPKRPMRVIPYLLCCRERLFYFYIFQKKITEIYFGFQNLQFYTPTARQGGGRGPTAPLLGGRDLFANKNKIYLRINPWWGPAAPLPGGRPPTAKWWGGRYLHLGYAPENFFSGIHMQRVGYHKIFRIFRQTKQWIQNKLD